jgi:hypothetical protein
VQFVTDVSEWTLLIVTQLLKHGLLIPIHQRLSTMPKARDCPAENSDTEKLFWFLLEDIFTADADAAARICMCVCVCIYVYVRI